MARLFSVLSLGLALALAILSTAVAYPGGTGRARTTHYWDCCKPSCGWRGNAEGVTNPVRSCGTWGNWYVGENDQSGCGGGSAFTCNDQQPFIDGGQAYAFAAAKVNGASLCCACYKLTFTNGPAQGQNLIVQVINTGADLDNNHFDLQLPGGGAGIFTEGCPRQFSGFTGSVWGNQYGGLSERWQCDALPNDLGNGCRFRFDWFRNADNPEANFERVACPATLSNKSNCRRYDD